MRLQRKGIALATAMIGLFCCFGQVLSNLGAFKPVPCLAYRAQALFLTKVGSNLGNCYSQMRTGHIRAYGRTAAVKSGHWHPSMTISKENELSKASGQAKYTLSIQRANLEYARKANMSFPTDANGHHQVPGSYLLEDYQQLFQGVDAEDAEDHVVSHILILYSPSMCFSFQCAHAHTSVIHRSYQ